MGQYISKPLGFNTLPFGPTMTFSWGSGLMTTWSKVLSGVNQGGGVDREVLLIGQRCHHDNIQHLQEVYQAQFNHGTSRESFSRWVLPIERRRHLNSVRNTLQLCTAGLRKPAPLPNCSHFTVCCPAPMHGRPRVFRAHPVPGTHVHVFNFPRQIIGQRARALYTTKLGAIRKVTNMYQVGHSASCDTFILLELVENSDPERETSSGDPSSENRGYMYVHHCELQYKHKLPPNMSRSLLLMFNVVDHGSTCGRDHTI